MKKLLPVYINNIIQRKWSEFTDTNALFLLLFMMCDQSLMCLNSAISSISRNTTTVATSVLTIFDLYLLVVYCICSVLLTQFYFVCDFSHLYILSLPLRLRLLLLFLALSSFIPFIPLFCQGICAFLCTKTEITVSLRGRVFNGLCV